MPAYTYYCKKCDRYEDFVWSYKDFDVLKDSTCCKACGEKMEREFNSPAMRHDSQRNDPSSPFFWKRGKSLIQQAAVIDGGVAPY